MSQHYNDDDGDDDDDQIHITPSERKITIKLHIDHTYHNKSDNYIIRHRFG